MIKQVAVFGIVALLGVVSASPLEVTPRRIINGTATTIDRIPFQVSIGWGGNQQWCGGSILDENTILTAAHCFDWHFEYEDPLSDWTIRAGSSYWNEGGVVVNIVNATRHAQYNYTTYDYDVAILKLETNLTFSENIQPVVLAQANSSLAANQSIQVSGWGHVNNWGVIPDQLQKIIMPVLDDELCRAKFAEINPITDRMFCAGDTQGMGDSCNGDSGGPLVDLVDNVQYGLVSWGLDCAMEGFTGVYTNLPYFHEWIQEARREMNI